MSTIAALWFASFCLSGRALALPKLLTDQWNLYVSAAGDASIKRSDDGSVKITVRKATDPLWDTQIMQPVASSIPKDDQIELSFRARSPTRNFVRVEIEQTGPPYNGVAELKPTLEADWESYQIRGISPGYSGGGLSVRFQVGQRAGVIELADIRLDDLGPDRTIIEARSAIKPSAIAARIDRYRKRTLKLHVVDSAGRAVPGVQIEVSQSRHAFWFGSNLFGLDVNATDQSQKEYQARFSALFNYATLPFYWGSYEAVAGQTEQTRLMSMASWCRDHGIVAKGHPLVYHIVYPRWAPSDAASTMPLLHARITDLISRYDGLVNVWDVINEANSPPVHPSTGIDDWIAKDGAVKVVGTVLGWARAADPKHQDVFLYNDYDRGATNLAMIRSLAERHQLPDAIGIQSHMHSVNWDLPDVWRTAEQFARFGRPIHFTETTVLSGDHRPFPNDSAPPATDWLTTPAAEKEQAEYVVQFYSILFSHPALRAITWWDFSDHNAWLGAPAGLLRKDMSPKPAYDALMKLIHHDWWTHAALVSNVDGDCQLRAFCGDYVLTITDARGRQQQQRITLPMPTDRSSGDVKIDLKLN